MDPISIILLALTSGAAAGLKPAAEKAVSDAYEGIKSLLKKKYQDKVEVEMLEKDPTSEGRKAVVKEGLDKVAAGSDEEVLQKSKELLEAVEKHAPETAAAIGVDLEAIRGASLQLRDIIATGTGVRAKNVEVTGDIVIEGVRAGQSAQNSSSKSPNA